MPQKLLKKVALTKLAKSKEKTFVALQVLKQCRVDLIQDFLNHQPDIYTPSFKYEDSPVLLRLAREKYFLSWLGTHWHKFNHKAISFTDNQKDYEEFFAKVYLKLLEKWSMVKTVHTGQLSLGIRLIDDMQKTLNEFIKAGNNADAMRNKLEIEIEKNRVLFDREMKKINEDK